MNIRIPRFCSPPWPRSSPAWRDGWAESAPAAVSTDHPTRIEESKQKAVTTSPTAPPRSSSLLVDEYQYNRIGQEDQLKTLRQVSDGLKSLTDAGASTPTMPWVVSKLAVSRQQAEAEAKSKELAAASDGQDKIIKSLSDLIALTKGKFANVGLKSDLSDVIKEQERVKAETQKLGDETLGKKADKLTPEQKADADKLATQQNAVQQTLAKAIDDLKQEAKDAAAADPATAKAIDEALRSSIPRPCSRRSSRRRRTWPRTRPTPPRTSSSRSSTSSRTPRSRSPPPRRARSPSSNSSCRRCRTRPRASRTCSTRPTPSTRTASSRTSTSSTPARPPPGRHPAAAQADQQPAAQAAAEEMKKAEQALGNRTRARPRRRMQAALADLQKAEQALAGEIAAQMPGSPVRPSRVPPALRDLPGPPGPPGPPEQVVQTQNMILNPQGDPKPGSQLLDGAKKEQVGAASWQVGLEPGSASALTSAKEKFPARYERQLALYYQNLRQRRHGQVKHRLSAPRAPAAGCRGRARSLRSPAPPGGPRGRRCGGDVARRLPGEQARARLPGGHPARGWRLARRPGRHHGIVASCCLAFLGAGQVPGRGEFGPMPRAPGIPDRDLAAQRPALPPGHARRPDVPPWPGHPVPGRGLGHEPGQGHPRHLKRAVELIVSTQNEKGGWRYQPRVADDDLSVTVMQLMALRAAKDAGIYVPKDVIDSGIEYVKRATTARMPARTAASPTSPAANPASRAPAPACSRCRSPATTAPRRSARASST